MVWENNFWGWLLQGIGALLLGILDKLPWHQALGLTEWVATVVFFAVVFLLLIVGSFIHLNWLAFLTISMLVLETARTILAAWRWLKTLLPHAP